MLYKLSLFKFLIISLLPLFSLALGNTVDNGGDTVAMEFTQTARLALKSIRQSKIPTNLVATVNMIAFKVDTAQVQSAPRLFLGVHEVDAINTPSKNLILVSRLRWFDQKSDAVYSRMSLVLHEYLGVSGMDDRNYALSTQLMELLYPSGVNSLPARQLLSQTLLSLHSNFWWYATETYNIEQTKVCMTAGELRIRIDVVGQFIVNNREWFSSFNRAANELSKLNDVLGKFVVLCQEPERNTRSLNEAANKGAIAVGQLMDLLWR